MYWLSTQVCVIQAHNKCSKCLPCARTHAVSHCLHWLTAKSMMCCCRTRSATAWLSVNGTRLADFLPGGSRYFPFSNLCQEIHSTSFVRPSPSTDKDFFYDNSVFVCDFHDFNFYLMLVYKFIVCKNYCYCSF